MVLCVSQCGVAIVKFELYSNGFKSLLCCVQVRPILMDARLL